MDELDLRAGADAAWELVSAANLFVQQNAPWALAKAGKHAELDDVLAALARSLGRLAVLVSPFIPAKAQALWRMLGQEGEVAKVRWSFIEEPATAGRTVTTPEVLFPKPATV
jgi:methionyl-tRNA synthetase